MMAKYTDALRGYAFEIHKRDNFICRYCGADGKKSFDTWLTLSWDHLLPKGNPNRDNPDYIVTACMFCNTADNRFFDNAEERGIRFEGMTQKELVAQRLPYVLKTRQSYSEFWQNCVHSSADTLIGNTEHEINPIGNDGQLANEDLQNMLQKLQQILQMVSNISNLVNDIDMAIIRKIGG